MDYLSLLEVPDHLKLLSSVNLLGQGGQFVSGVDHRRPVLCDDLESGVADLVAAAQAAFDAGSLVGLHVGVDADHCNVLSFRNES